MENQNNLIKCPKCQSTQLTTSKKGFSGKKAVVGAVLTGGIGILAGTIGSNKIKVNCIACGNSWLPSEYEKLTKPKPVEKPVERYIKSEYDMLSKRFVTLYNVHGASSDKVIDLYKKCKNITDDTNPPSEFEIKQFYDSLTDQNNYATIFLGLIIIIAIVVVIISFL